MPEIGAEVIERPADFIWFSKDNILCSVPKEKAVELTMEESMKQIEEWEAEHADKKYWMLSVVNPHAKSSKEQRDWAAEILPKYVHGIACINDSALGRMAINLFIGLRPPTYPLKMFKSSEEAFEWINQNRTDE